MLCKLYRKITFQFIGFSLCTERVKNNLNGTFYGILLVSHHIDSHSHSNHNWLIGAEKCALT
jgi:hypothetical protein